MPRPIDRLIEAIKNLPSSEFSDVEKQLIINRVDERPTREEIDQAFKQVQQREGGAWV